MERTTKRIPKEYVEKLKEHPYVERVTERSISYTPEFKRIAYEEYCSGKNIRNVFKDAGFDVELLGTSRINSFRERITASAESNPEFEDQRKSSSRKELNTEAQMAKRIRELEHLNAYLEQENEFLKKIRSVGKG